MKSFAFLGDFITRFVTRKIFEEASRHFQNRDGLANSH